jgi:hypothetical protein
VARQTLDGKLAFAGGTSESETGLDQGDGQAALALPRWRSQRQERPPTRADLVSHASFKPYADVRGDLEGAYLSSVAANQLTVLPDGICPGRRMGVRPSR